MYSSSFIIRTVAMQFLQYTMQNKLIVVLWKEFAYLLTGFYLCFGCFGVFHLMFVYGHIVHHVHCFSVVAASLDDDDVCMKNIM